MRNEGFALTEVLIAAAIAAGVIGAAATGLTVAIRGAKTTADANLALVEAGTLAARLHAGMMPGEALDGLAEWSLSFKDISEAGAAFPWKAYEVAATRKGMRPFDFTTVIVRPREEPIDAK